jgi:hypothetical protein
VPTDAPKPDSPKPESPDNGGRIDRRLFESTFPIQISRKLRVQLGEFPTDSTARVDVMERNLDLRFGPGGRLFRWDRTGAFIVQKDDGRLRVRVDRSVRNNLQAYDPQAFSVVLADRLNSPVLVEHPTPSSRTIPRPDTVRPRRDDTDTQVADRRGVADPGNPADPTSLLSPFNPLSPFWVGLSDTTNSGDRDTPGVECDPEPSSERAGVGDYCAPETGSTDTGSTGSSYDSGPTHDSSPSYDSGSSGGYDSGSSYDSGGSSYDSGGGGFGD